MSKFPSFLLTRFDFIINEMARDICIELTDLLTVLTYSIITKVTTVSNHITGSALLPFECTALFPS